MTYTETLDPINGHTIELIAMDDTDGLNPREYDNLGVMAAYHRRYDLGDSTDEVDTLRSAMDNARRLRFDVIARYCRIRFGSTVCIPLGLIDHSGLSMYVGGGAHVMDPGGWDSGTIGFIFDTAATRAMCWGETTPTQEQVREGLISEVQEYDRWLTGDAWGYRICDANGNEVEEVWGFLGHEYAEQEARAAVPTV